MSRLTDKPVPRPGPAKGKSRFNVPDETAPEVPRWTGRIRPYSDWLRHDIHEFEETDGTWSLCGGPKMCKFCIIARAERAARRKAKRNADT